MALINCPECGKEISDKAKACPRCGAPAKVLESPEKAEKKTSALKVFIVIAITIAVIGGCVVAGIYQQQQEEKRLREKYERSDVAKELDKIHDAINESAENVEDILDNIEGRYDEWERLTGEKPN